MRQFINSRFSPFRSAPFRQFFFVQSFSLIGLWAFDLARAWIVVDGLGRAAELGIVLSAGALPPLFITLYAGAMVDRMDVRRVVIFCKAALATLSLVLAFIVEFGEIQIWHLIGFSLLQGVVNAFDGPTFNLLTVRLVPKQDFQQAIAINSTNFHASRALGPAIAGLLMALHGPSLVFLFDALTYFALIFVLKDIQFRDVKAHKKTETPETEETENHETGDLHALAEGIKYIFRHPQLRYQLAQLYATICLMFPILIVVLRAYIKFKFKLSGEEFSYLWAVAASGSALAAVSVTLFQPKAPVRGLFIGIPLAVVSVIGLRWTNDLFATGLTLFVTGFSVYLCFASLTISLNLVVDEEYRGRLGSVMTLGFFSIGPLLGYPVGVLAENIGYEITMLWTTLGFAFLSATLPFLAIKRS